MGEQLSKVYEPKIIEQQVNTIWSKGNYFHAKAGDKDRKKPYVIVIPPPNVTAPLHLGHALNNTLQDILIRYHRMQNFNALWMPGTDHAGIATQTVVEKRILAEEGKKRIDFQREEFVARVQAWKDEYEAKIIEQLKAMGCSCDWERTRFTMDEVCAQAVRAAFFKLFKDGLIYRGKRLVNWDPATQTVLADDEVEYETVKGHFWYLQYPLVNAITIGGKITEHVTVATTRPETMLGDTAVAMNPADRRARYLVGQKVLLPIVGRIIPIIADENVVLPDANSEDEKAKFSTGFLKVTPAHDPTDWEIGQRNNLDIINVLAPDGTISDKHGWKDWEKIKNPDVENLIGMDRFEAREAVVEWFRKEELLEEVREYIHEVGHSYRSHVPVEPYLSDQWFIAVKKSINHLEDKFGEGFIEGTDIPINSLAGLALKPLLDSRLKFTPERYANTYKNWLENLRDWPISRQLWWGHQIPIWHKRVTLTEQNWTDELLEWGWDDYVGGNWKKDSIIVRLVNIENGREVNPKANPLMPVTKRTEGEYDIYICPLEDKTLKEFEFEKFRFKRDVDVLDTWFSSALWPFSTMGWPQETAEVKEFYPTNLLCTAREIITLWVSRMVMMGQYCAGNIPFSDVYIHAMILDGEGRKMSKSLGNGIDPLVVIDSHGADAMRFTLASMATETQDIRMPVVSMTLPDGRQANTSPKFDLGRNFCNKLWNASRFALMNLEGTEPAKFDKNKLMVSDRWILSRLAKTIAQTTESIEKYQFSEPVNMLYKFFWNDFCDWYLEWIKPRMRDEKQKPIAQNVLAFTLDQILRLMHPFVPFITEGIFQKLNEIAPVRQLLGISDAKKSEALVIAEWPQRIDFLTDETAEKEIELVQMAVGTIRDIRSGQNIQPKELLTVTVKAIEETSEILNRNAPLIEQLAGVKDFKAGIGIVKPENAIAAISDVMAIYVHYTLDIEAEKTRLNKQKDEVENAKKSIEAKLSNVNFVSKAKPEVVNQARERLTELTEQLEKIKKHIQELEK